MTENPLAEADPQSLQILFDTDPLQLSDSDIDKIVEELRAQRARWQQKEGKPRKKADMVTVSLDDLGL